MTEKAASLGELLTSRREAKGWSQADFAERVGVGQTTVSAWESGRTSTIRNWRFVADTLDIPHDEFRALMGRSLVAAEKTTRIPPAVREAVSGILKGQLIPVVDQPVVGARDVPALGRAKGGQDGRFDFNGEVLGWEMRPPQLDGVKNGYAVYADGDSMYPRYKPGETVWVNPNIPARRGDDVVVQLYGEDEFDAPFGFLKEFVGWHGSRLVLRQFNPDSEISYDRDKVKSVHLVVYAGRR